jgi:hypothetical protein
MSMGRNCAELTARLVIISIALSSVNGCARVVRQPFPQSSPVALTELWNEPIDLESRDLYHGAGGAQLAPQSATYRFVAHKKAGTNPGYDVRDSLGQRWSVKLGDEAQSEVTASRVLWAVGFHQPPAYYVGTWTLVGGDVATPPPGRFRIDPPGQDVVGEWSWYDNAFIGSRPFAALIAINMLLNNWDLKTSNNKVYVVTDEHGVRERRFIVRDLGASLGKARQPAVLSWLPFMRHKQGSKNDLEDFEAQDFVRSITGQKIEFAYRGIDASLVRSVTADDLRWTCTLLSRLSERQWLDAFRAGGYSDDQRMRYVRRIQAKIIHAQALLGGRPDGSFTETAALPE